MISAKKYRNNRMGKTRDLFRKIRDTKGTFHAKMCSIRERNGMDLTEAEDTKERWQEYTDDLYRKELHDPDNHSGVITDIEPYKKVLMTWIPQWCSHSPRARHPGM